MAIAFPVVTATGALLDQSRFVIRELAWDGFSWAAILTCNIIVSFFLANIWFNTGRYKQGESTDKHTGSGEGVHGTKSFKLKVRSMNRLDTQGHHAMPMSPHAVQLSVTDFDMVTPTHKEDDASAIDEKEKW
jgi:hypothetical protein